MSDEKQEPQLMALLTELVKQFSDYDPPRLRKDGERDHNITIFSQPWRIVIGKLLHQLSQRRHQLWFLFFV